MRYGVLSGEAGKKIRFSSGCPSVSTEKILLYHQAYSFLSIPYPVDSQ